MDYETLWERFVADGLLTPAERDAARARQQRRGGTPDTAVLEVRNLTRAERLRLLEVAGEVTGFAVAAPDAISSADPEVLDRLPAALRRHHALLPTRMLGPNTLEVVTALNPPYVISEIARLIGCTIEARLALEVEVRGALSERMGLAMPPRFIPLAEALRRADARDRPQPPGVPGVRATPATLAMGFAEELARALDSLDAPQTGRQIPSTAPLPGNHPLSVPRRGSGLIADPSRMPTPVRPMAGIVAEARSGAAGLLGPSGTPSRGDEEISFGETSQGGTPLFGARVPNRSGVNRSREGSHRIEAPFGMPRPSRTEAPRPDPGPARRSAPADETSFADLDLDEAPPARRRLSSVPPHRELDSNPSEFGSTDFSMNEGSVSDANMIIDAVLLDGDRDRPTLQKTPIGGFRIVDPALLVPDAAPRDPNSRDGAQRGNTQRFLRESLLSDSSQNGAANAAHDSQPPSRAGSRDSARDRRVVLRLDAEPSRETGPMPLVRGPQSAPSAIENSMRQAVRDLGDPTRLDLAMSRLRGAGARAIDTLVAGFPGPLHVDRAQVDPLQVAVRDHGPLLRILLDLGPLAAEALLPLIDTTELEVRHYAVFAFTVLDPGSALPRLGTRLFDPDPGVRRVALLAVHHWRTRPEFPNVVQFVARVVRAGRTGQAKLAIAILARLKALGGALALLDLLLEDRDGLGDPAHKALVEMTRQDFGYAAHHWQAWLERNAMRPRVELLIEALDHPSRSIRGGALAELRALTGDTLGYQVDGAPTDRRTAVDHWWRWWQADGIASLGHYR